MKLIDAMRIDFDEVDITECTDVDDIIYAVERLIDAQPAVDAVEVVHGWWVNAAGCRTICNHCGEYPLYDYWGKLKFSAYCPNCGAKMDGDRNG